jgi:hypothetical protein
MDVVQDESARFSFTVKPNGTLDDMQRLDPNSPLTKTAFGCIVGVVFPELPASLARGAGLPVRVTFSKHGVSVVELRHPAP